MKLIYNEIDLKFVLLNRNTTLFHGGLVDLMDFITENDLMDLSDLSEAIDDMDSNGNDIAHFGVCGGFLFSEEMQGFSC